MSIPVEISEYPNVAERAAALGCRVPTGVALLPGNFDTAKTRQELLFEGKISPLRELWRKANVVETPIEPPGEDIWCVGYKDFDLVVPTIFIGFSLLSQNQAMVSIALNVISNYLTDWFKGLGPGTKQVAEVNVVVETPKKTCKHVHYKGPVEGLEELPDILRAAGMDEK